MVDAVEDGQGKYEDVNASVAGGRDGMVARVFDRVRFAVDVMLVDNSEFVGKTLTRQNMSRILIADGMEHEDTILEDYNMKVENVHEGGGIVDVVGLVAKDTVAGLTIRRHN